MPRIAKKSADGFNVTVRVIFSFSAARLGRNDSRYSARASSPCRRADRPCTLAAGGVVVPGSEESLFVAFNPEIVQDIFIVSAWSFRFRPAPSVGDDSRIPCILERGWVQLSAKLTTERDQHALDIFRLRRRKRTASPAEKSSPSMEMPHFFGKMEHCEAWDDVALIWCASRCETLCKTACVPSFRRCDVRRGNGVLLMAF